MQTRLAACVAATFVSAALLGACTRPGGGYPGGGGHSGGGSHSGGGGTSLPGPAPGDRDCGTITVDAVATQAERNAGDCFFTYHGGANVYVKSVKGSNVIVAQAAHHEVTITLATMDSRGNATVTKQTVCSGFADSQFQATPAAGVTGIAGNRCGL